MTAGLQVGIDIGGTFTDLTLSDPATGEATHHKLPTTPDDPARALIDGLSALTTSVGAAPTDIAYFVHGTTLGLNTLLQRRGARLALVVSRGMRNVLDLERLRVPEQFSFTPSIPAPLVSPELVYPLGGRMLASGAEHEPLGENELDELVAWLRASGADACAVSLLNAYVNPEHERRAEAAIAQALPDMALSISSRVWPEVREFERSIVTAMNAYVAPQMGRYFAHLTGELETAGVPGRPFITRSNGGLMSVEEAAEIPVETLLSGPAAGVVGAQREARLAGLNDCVTFDMGGTSADVSVIIEGEPARSTETRVGSLPIVIPSVDVTAIGAGGGSIAWLDAAGVLKVGPHSAGAAPGPACYGLGGTEPTITDAYLVCGFLDPERFAGGTLELQRAPAEAALGGLGERLGMDATQTAEAVLRIASATMVARLLPLMARLGIDPREFALLPYGGAGPTHACLLAREVGIARVLVPRHPGTLCATGALVNDLSRDWVRSFRARLEGTAVDGLRAELDALTATARGWLEQQRETIESSQLAFALDMRYVGQAYELEVPIEIELLDQPDELRARFHRRHETVHRHADLSAPVEVINLRVRAIGRTPGLAEGSPETGRTESAEPIGTRAIMVDGAGHDAAVYSRSALAPGTRVSGPCLVEQEDTTIPILPGFSFEVDGRHNLVVRADG